MRQEPTTSDSNVNFRKLLFFIQADYLDKDIPKHKTYLLDTAFFCYASFDSNNSHYLHPRAEVLQQKSSIYRNKCTCTSGQSFVLYVLQAAGIYMFAPWTAWYTSNHPSVNC